MTTTEINYGTRTINVICPMSGAIAGRITYLAALNYTGTGVPAMSDIGQGGELHQHLIDEALEAVNPQLRAAADLQLIAEIGMTRGLSLKNALRVIKTIYVSRSHIDLITTSLLWGAFRDPERHAWYKTLMDELDRVRNIAPPSGRGRVSTSVEAAIRHGMIAA